MTLDIYRLQDEVLARLQAISDGELSRAKLCGGTALSRCWLHHRVSHDLDFFMPDGFKAMALARSLKQHGVSYEVSEMVDDARLANQLHGFVVSNGKRLKVSFIEDSYYDVYPPARTAFGSLTVTTEAIPGLYHRKLRTVSGRVSEGSEVVGGRQTARDLFDLYVLSQAYMPIRQFIEAVPYAFPSDAFDNGLASMPWMSLTNELAEITCDPKWERAKDISHLQETLFREIGATAVDDFDDAPEEETQRRAVRKPGGRT